MEGRENTIRADYMQLRSQRKLHTVKNQFLFLLFTEGSGYFLQQKNIEDFTAGSCILFHDLPDFFIVPQYHEACSYIEISFFQSDILYSAFSEPALALLDSWLNAPENVSAWTLGNYDFQTVRQFCDLCVQLQKDNFPYALSVKSQTVSTLMFYLARLHDRLYTQRRHRVREASPHTVMIEKVRQYIQRNYANTVSLSEIADFVYTNPSYLSRIFKNETGITLSAYINQVRIEAAKQMITDTDELMIDIAIACGYNYIPHFNKIFKSFTGMTPTQYKKMYKKSYF